MSVDGGFNQQVWSQSNFTGVTIGLNGYQPELYGQPGEFKWGITRVDRVYHIDRGNEKIEEKLRAVGADIQRVSDR